MTLGQRELLEERLSGRTPSSSECRKLGLVIRGKRQKTFGDREEPGGFRHGAPGVPMSYRDLQAVFFFL